MSAARGIGAAAAVAMHTLAVAVLLSYEPARSALLSAAPIMVELIQPPRTEPPKPEPPTQLPKPLPVARHAPLPPSEPLPMLATAAPSPFTAPAPPQISTPVAALAANPVPLSAPVFDADYLHNPAPVYPRLARRLGEQGRVVLRVLVNARGTADEVQVQTTSTHPMLDEAARETVRAWTFVPARRGAEAVPAWVLIPISFRLES